jgi:regulator of cell morphogenesis and NO signaling
MQESISSKTIGDIVTADFRTANVFERNGIDFCCGGKRTLASICAEHGLALEAIIEELNEVQREPLGRSPDYSRWTLTFLADYIVNTHHVYLKENDEQIAAYARKIAAVHGANHPEVIQIAEIFEKIAADMVRHLQEEEEVFFPAIKRAEAAKAAEAKVADKDRETIRRSLARLHREHEEIGDATHEIRRLAKGYLLPDDACNSFRITYQKLEEFEDDLHKHVHLENNILFPKAEML